MSENEDGRAERLKAALRDNLRRRKAQERARAPEDAARPEAGRPGIDEPREPRGHVPDSDKSRL